MFSHQLDDALLKSVTRDEQSLKKEGYQVKWLTNQKSFHRAIIEKSEFSNK